MKFHGNISQGNILTFTNFKILSLQKFLYKFVRTSSNKQSTSDIVMALTQSHLNISVNIVTY